MGTKRRRNWWINVCLWVFPLAAIGAFSVWFLVARRPEFSTSGELLPSAAQLFYPPSKMAWVFLASTLLLSFVFAVGTRRLLGFLAGTSLLVMVLIAVLWIRSHWHCDQIAFIREEANGGVTKIAGIQLGTGQVYCTSLRFMHLGDVNGSGILPPGETQSIMFISMEPNNASLTDDVGFESPLWLKKLGFAAAFRPKMQWDNGRGGIELALAMPHWFPLLIATPLPLAWVVRYRRRRRWHRRLVQGQCTVCGYDLRATPNQAGARLAVCPECGNATATSAAE